MSLSTALAIATLVATVLGILGRAVHAGAWIADWFRRRRSGGSPPYPVRLTCTDVSDFHPSAGFHEGFHIEVFNESEKPVTIRGFGLDLTMQGQAEWHRYESVIQRPARSFPLRLAPNDGLDGHINAEALSDQVYTDREDKNWVATHAYVDVAGYGKRTIRVV